jgi:hypothetical protein
MEETTLMWTFFTLKIEIKLSQNQSIRVSTIAVTKVAIYKHFMLSPLVVSRFIVFTNFLRIVDCIYGFMTTASREKDEIDT